MVAACGDGDDDSGSTPSTAPAPSTSDSPPSTASPTSTTATTTAPTTTTPVTTIAPTTIAPTTIAPATTAPPEGPAPDATDWQIDSPYFGSITLTLAVDVPGVAVYDGAVEQPFPVRCLRVVADGEDSWQEWCGEADRPGSFVALAGIEPWLVEFDAPVGDVTATARPATWSLPTNGCSAGVVPLIDALAPTPAVVTGLVCVPGEAFATFSSVLLQAGPSDGGGALLVDGDEGWTSTGAGTSIGCDDLADGVDRCALFDVEWELFEATLPIPPASIADATTDVVDVHDETDTVRAWALDAPDADSADSAVVAALVDPDAELPAVVDRVDTAYGLRLLQVELPEADDSIVSTTFAVWIGAGGDIVRATAWTTCARGVSDDLCV